MININKILLKRKRLILGLTVTSIAAISIGASRAGYISNYTMRTDDSLFAKASIYLNAVNRCVRVGLTVATIAVDYKWNLMKRITSSMTQEELSSHMSKLHQRLLDLFKKNGGIYVKLGQHIAALTYLLPDEYTNTMKVLQDMCPQSSIESVRTVIERDTGIKMDDLFDEFDLVPVGSASLAQVHRGKLKSGEEVAVKVQHYYVNYFAPFDIALTNVMVKAIKYVFPEFEFDWLADEMRQNLPRELDFEHEAKNCRRLDNYFRNENLYLKVPYIFWSTKRSLCMEFIKGRRIDDVEYLKSQNINPSKVFEALSHIYGAMIFKFGFVHCDPHPGNILVRPTGTKQKFEIVLLDHGLYKELNENFIDDYARVWIALMSGNELDIKKYATNLGGGNAYIVFSCVLTARSWESVTSKNLKSGKTKEEEQNIKAHAGNFIREIAYLLAHVPRELLLLFKTNDLLRSIEQDLLKHDDSYLSYFSMFHFCIRAVLSSDLKNSKFFYQKLGSWFQFYLNSMVLFISKVFMLLNHSFQ